MQHYERAELLKRVRPNKANSADLRRAVEQCFDFADAVASERRGLSLDLSMNAPKRRDALGRYINGDLFQPLANALHPVAKLKKVVDAMRADAGRNNPPPEVIALGQDIDAVEAALYFAKREVKDATDVSPFDLDALLTSRAS